MTEPAGLVDSHVHLTFATHGENPAPRGSREIQELYLRRQTAAGVTLVRDCGETPESVPPPTGPGLPEVIRCGPMLAPAIPFLAHLRTPVAPERLLETAVARIRSGASWIKVLADAPGADGNMLAATPTYPSELIAELCAAVHREGGRVAAHTTGPSAPALVSAGVDSIEHGGWLAPDAIAELGARGGAWTPTLGTALHHLKPMIDASHPAASFLQRHLDGIAAMLPHAVEAGVVILAGTDEQPHGSIAEETDLLHQFGLTTDQANDAASDNARAFLTKR